MLFILLVMTGVYFFIIANLREEHTKSLNKSNEEFPENSFVKMTDHIFEVLNKVSLALLATLLVCNILRNKPSELGLTNCGNVEFMLWFAFIHLANTTFLYGLLEILVLRETVKKK